MKTRTGKIARLPKEIREQLNSRLQNGEPGTTLVDWLNQLPEVQKILTEQFSNQPIRVQNLSDWKRGGYVDWLRHQELRELVRWNHQRSSEFAEDEGDNDICDSLGSYLSAQLVIHARELSRMRRDDHRYRRFELRKQQWESTLEPVEPNSTQEPETTPQVHQSIKQSPHILPNPA